MLKNKSNAKLHGEMKWFSNLLNKCGREGKAQQMNRAIKFVEQHPLKIVKINVEAF